jgi:hypothetical protein
MSAPSNGDGYLLALAVVLAIALGVLVGLGVS